MPPIAQPAGTSNSIVDRRHVLRGVGAAGVCLPLAGLAGAGAPGPARAADYPPTNGAMQGFILFEERRRIETTPFQDAGGNVRHFSDFTGRVLLVNFWATWCAPCIEEMPDLAALHDALGGPDFGVLAISQDRGGPGVAEPFTRERLGLPDLPIYYDRNSALGRAMGIKGLPTTFLIDRQGRAVGYLAGAAKWNTPGAKALVRHLIAEGRGAQLDQA